MKNVEIVVDAVEFPRELVERYPALRELDRERQLAIERKIAELERDTDTVQALARFSEPEVREAVEFYNHVVRDGRFVSMLAQDPEAVAGYLNLTISKSTSAFLQEIRHRILPEVAIVVGIAVIIVVDGITTGVAIVMSAPKEQLAHESPDSEHPVSERPRLIVQDRSFQLKL